MKSELVVCSSNAKANFPLKTTFNNTIQITAENVRFLHFPPSISLRSHVQCWSIAWFYPQNFSHLLRVFQNRLLFAFLPCNLGFVERFPCFEWLPTFCWNFIAHIKEAVPGVGVETRESVPINFQKIKKKIATKSYAGEHNALCGWIAFTNYIIRAHWINCWGLCFFFKTLNVFFFK